MTEQFNGATAKPSMTDDKTLIDGLQAISAGTRRSYGNHHMADFLKTVEKRLQALTQGDVVLWPEEPTEAMLDAYKNSLESPCDAKSWPYHRLKAIKRYKAMRAAAQQPAGENEG